MDPARDRLQRWCGPCRFAEPALLLSANTRVLRGDWLSPFADGSLDAVVSNPPYIPDADPHLSRGDLPFEPRGALAAGRDGLDAIRRLTSEATSRLSPGGLLLMEHGFDQGPATRAILRDHGFTRIDTRRDLARLERCTAGFLLL